MGVRYVKDSQRIADALERIADALAGRDAEPTSDCGDEGDCWPEATTLDALVAADTLDAAADVWLQQHKGRDAHGVAAALKREAAVLLIVGARETETR